MTPAYLHDKLMEACKNGTVEEVQYYLDAGVTPNFNLKRPTNALHVAIQRDNYQMINLLLEHGAIVKEFVLQKAIERDKNYLQLLVPNFANCKDETLLMGVLQAAINRGDLALATQAIDQGAKAELLVLSAIGDLGSTEILALLLENGFNIHADKNMILTEWMGSSAIGYKSKPPKPDLLAFLCDYYLDKPKSIEKFKSLGFTEKLRLFRMGLDGNHLIMMKFAFVIGADKNEALNSAFYRYYAYKHDNSGVHSTLFQNHKHAKVDYEIIGYMLRSNILFKKATISNAVCFKYIELLNALSCMEDLVYGYEMAYKYGDDSLLDYFSDRGVSKEAQNLAKMRVAAIKGDIKALRNAVNEGANVEVIDRDSIVEIINANQVASLKYLYNSGVVLDLSLNACLNKAMSQYKAYETISYLVELGFDISSVKNIPSAYQAKYPVLADMWTKRFSDIFDYTMYLATEVYPKLEGKEKEEILKRVAALSTLPYVIKKSKERF